MRVFDTLESLLGEASKQLGRPIVGRSTTFLAMAHKWLENGYEVQGAGGNSIIAPPLRLRSMEREVTFDVLPRDGTEVPADLLETHRMEGGMGNGQSMVLEFHDPTIYSQVDSELYGFLPTRFAYTIKRKKFQFTDVVQPPVNLTYYANIPPFDEATWAAHPVTQANDECVLHGFLAAAYRSFRNQAMYVAAFLDFVSCVEQMNEEVSRAAEGQSPLRMVIVGGVP